MQHTKFTAVLQVLQKRSYWRSNFSIVEIWIFNLFCSRDLDLDPMTFLYKLDPYSVEMYWRSKNELPTSRLSKVIV